MEGGVLQFKTQALVFRVSLHSEHMQSLHLKVASDPSVSALFDKDDLLLIERCFENKVQLHLSRYVSYYVIVQGADEQVVLQVACPPFSQMALEGFLCMITMAPHQVKELVRILHLETVRLKNPLPYNPSTRRNCFPVVVVL